MEAGKKRAYDVRNRNNSLLHKYYLLSSYVSATGEIPVRTEEGGIIIGKDNLPLVNEENALFHVACFERIELVESQLEEFMNMDQNLLDLYRVREPVSSP